MTSASGLSCIQLTTESRMVDRMRSEPSHYQGRAFYPCMPYAHKYANAMAESGVSVPSNSSCLTRLPRCRHARRKSFAGKDAEGMITLLIDAEMSMFDGMDTPVIFLQNVVVDFLLGMGFTEAFRIFSDYVSTKFKAEPGFITMNMPRLLDALDAVGEIIRSFVLISTKSDFECLAVSTCILMLHNRKFRAIVMSIFASGAILPTRRLVG